MYRDKYETDTIEGQSIPVDKNQSEETIHEKLLRFAELDNICEELTKEQLTEIGNNCFNDYQIDTSSRLEWLAKMQDAMKLAKQIQEDKTTPWPKAANVKLPIITDASIQFAARAYPEVIKNSRVVQTSVFLHDVPEMPDPPPENAPQEMQQQYQVLQKAIQGVEKLNKDLQAAANRVSKHMSFQLLVESDEWEANTDKLLHVLPVVGTVFKKVFYDPFKQQPRAMLCLPQDIIINNNISSLECARRITHRFFLSKNEIMQHQRAGFYSEMDIDVLCGDQSTEAVDGIGKPVELSVEDSNPLVSLLEQHCWIDLDGDGFEEPYIVTFTENNYKILRILAAYLPAGDNIRFNSEGKVYYIKRENYFVDYHFIPSLDGGYYSMGYGLLLYVQNECVNTLTNQLLDAGTLSNSQAGIIGSGLRIPKGEYKFRPGEWKQVTTTMGQDIKNNIVPLPVNPPSQTSFAMLQMLIAMGKSSSNILDMLGDQKTQNSPNVTTALFLEQALKVDSAIQKRLYKALKKEFDLIFNLNKIYLDPFVTFITPEGGEQVSTADYNNEKLKVFPVADPNLSSAALRIIIAQQLLALKDEPGVNKREILTRYLEALQVQSIQQILAPLPKPTDPPPLPEQEIMAKIEVDKSVAMLNISKAQNEPKRIDVAELNAKAIMLNNAGLLGKYKVDAINSTATTLAAIGEKALQNAYQEVNGIDKDMSDELNTMSQAISVEVPGEQLPANEQQAIGGDINQLNQISPIENAAQVQQQSMENPQVAIQERMLDDINRGQAVPTSGDQI